MAQSARHGMKNIGWNIGNTKKKKKKGKGTARIGISGCERKKKYIKNQPTADHGPKLGSANTLCLDSACH